MSESTLLFDSSGKPSEPLLELLAVFNVAHDGTLTGIRDATQAAWYQAGKLRVEIQERHGDREDRAMSLFQQLGLLDAVRASQMQYLHVLLLGATVVAVRKRLAFLRDEWQRGVRFDNIFLLGSKRRLLADKESPDVLLNMNNPDLPFGQPVNPVFLPENEAAMMAMAHECAPLPWKDTVRPVLVTAPDAEGRNANTADTLREWNALPVTGGSCLVVSSQPFVSFQRLVARKLISLRHDVVDGIGYAAPATLPVSTYLDNVAKVIYELAS